MSDKSLQLYRMIKYLREKVKGRRIFLRPLTLLSKKVWPSLTIRITLRFMPRLYAKGVQFDTPLREKCFLRRTCHRRKRLNLFFAGLKNSARLFCSLSQRTQSISEPLDFFKDTGFPDPGAAGRRDSSANAPELPPNENRVYSPPAGGAPRSHVPPPPGAP